MQIDVYPTASRKVAFTLFIRHSQHLFIQTEIVNSDLSRKTLMNVLEQLAYRMSTFQSKWSNHAHR